MCDSILIPPVPRKSEKSGRMHHFKVQGHRSSGMTWLADKKQLLVFYVLYYLDAYIYFINNLYLF